MLKLIREISQKGKARVILSSHLLKDVEESCEEVLILKKGEIAIYCNLEEERKENRQFIECAYSGDKDAFIALLAEHGCEVAQPRKQHLKIILADGLKPTDLFSFAAKTGALLKRLSFKKDSLEDIFLNAMEENNGGV
jgi:ABC-2 type transport system ATP-binding protein